MALQSAIMNFKNTKPEDAPLIDFERSAKPPKVAELCHKLGFKYPPNQKGLNDRHISLQFTTSRQHCFHDYHMRSIVDPSSPFQDLVLARHVARHEKESLWLNVIELGGKKVSPVVKTRGDKRVKHAFAAALKLNGYDKYGNPLSDKEARRARTRPAANWLYGTVRVKLFDLKKVCSVPFTDVVDFWNRQVQGKIGIELARRTAPQDGINAVGGDRSRGTSSGGRAVIEGGRSVGAPRDANSIQRAPGGRSGVFDPRGTRQERRPRGERSDGHEQDSTRSEVPGEALRSKRPVRAERRPTRTSFI